MKGRKDLDIIAGLVGEGDRVLDLGCGGGELLDILALRKGARGLGLEINLERVIGAVARGISVIRQDINEPLENFPDGSFDTVILSQTIQEIIRPDIKIMEMLRIGKRGIISFPNFGHWRLRLGYFLGGRVPKSESLPFDWYDTPNIHFLTYSDFVLFCRKNGIKIRKTVFISGSRILPPFLVPNLLAASCIVLIETK